MTAPETHNASHLLAGGGERKRQLRSERALADAALAGQHQNLVPHAAQALLYCSQVWVDALGGRRAGGLVGAAGACGGLAGLLALRADALCAPKNWLLSILGKRFYALLDADVQARWSKWPAPSVALPTSLLCVLMHTLHTAARQMGSAGTVKQRTYKNKAHMSQPTALRANALCA